MLKPNSITNGVAEKKKVSMAAAAAAAAPPPATKRRRTVNYDHDEDDKEAEADLQPPSVSEPEEEQEDVEPEVPEAEDLEPTVEELEAERKARSKAKPARKRAPRKRKTAAAAAADASDEKAEENDVEMVVAVPLEERTKMMALLHRAEYLTKSWRGPEDHSALSPSAAAAAGAESSAAPMVVEGVELRSRHVLPFLELLSNTNNSYTSLHHAMHLQHLRMSSNSKLLTHNSGGGSGSGAAMMTVKLQGEEAKIKYRKPVMIKTPCRLMDSTYRPVLPIDWAMFGHTHLDLPSPKFAGCTTRDFQQHVLSCILQSAQPHERGTMSLITIDNLQTLQAAINKGFRTELVKHNLLHSAEDVRFDVSLASMKRDLVAAAATPAKGGGGGGGGGKKKKEDGIPIGMVSDRLIEDFFKLKLSQFPTASTDPAVKKPLAAAAASHKRSAAVVSSPTSEAASAALSKLDAAVVEVFERELQRNSIDRKRAPGASGSLSRDTPCGPKADALISLNALDPRITAYMSELYSMVQKLRQENEAIANGTRWSAKSLGLTAATADAADWEHKDSDFLVQPVYVFLDGFHVRPGRCPKNDKWIRTPTKVEVTDWTIDTDIRELYTNFMENPEAMFDKVQFQLWQSIPALRAVMVATPSDTKKEQKVKGPVEAFICEPGYWALVAEMISGDGGTLVEALEKHLTRLNAAVHVMTYKYHQGVDCLTDEEIMKHFPALFGLQDIKRIHKVVALIRKYPTLFIIPPEPVEMGWGYPQFKVGTVVPYCSWLPYRWSPTGSFLGWTILQRLNFVAGPENPIPRNGKKSWQMSEFLDISKRLRELQLGVPLMAPTLDGLQYYESLSPRPPLPLEKAGKEERATVKKCLSVSDLVLRGLTLTQAQHCHTPSGLEGVDTPLPNYMPLGRSTALHPLACAALGVDPVTRKHVPWVNGRSQFLAALKDPDHVWIPETKVSWPKQNLWQVIQEQCGPTPPSPTLSATAAEAAPASPKKRAKKPSDAAVVVPSAPPKRQKSVEARPRRGPKKPAVAAAAAAAVTAPEAVAPQKPKKSVEEVDSVPFADAEMASADEQQPPSTPPNNQQAWPFTPLAPVPAPVAERKIEVLSDEEPAEDASMAVPADAPASQPPPPAVAAAAASEAPAKPKAKLGVKWKDPEEEEEEESSPQAAEEEEEEEG